jgi:hypothetical protein
MVVSGRGHGAGLGAGLQPGGLQGLEAWLIDWPEEWELIVVAEATVRRHPTLTAQWCSGDDVPEVATGDDHAEVPAYGAVAPLTGRTHDHLSPELGKGDFAPFLQPLLADYPRQQLLVIQDRGEQQRGAPVEAVIRDASGRLMLKPQPADSPELKPQERIWKWWRRVVTHHHWLVPLHEPIEAIRNFFRDLAGVKDQAHQ